MSERTPTWQELLDTAVEQRTPTAFRAALDRFRDEGFTYDRLVVVANGIVESWEFPGFEGVGRGPSKDAWVNALTVKGWKARRLPDWKYVELLVVAYCKHHGLGGEAQDGLVVRWADGYTVCGGQPRSKYRRSTATVVARRRRVPYVVGTVVVALAASSAYVFWERDPESPLSVDDVSSLGLSKGDYIFPSTMTLSSSQVEELKNEDYGDGLKFDEWFRQNEGVPSHFRTITLTVSGRSEKQLRITNIDLLKENCTPPLTGTLFLNGGTNGGEEETRTLFFNLDDRLPEPTDENGEPYFARKSITLKKGESETIAAFVSANERSCGFTFRFTVVVPGRKPVKLEVDDDGKLFRLTAPANGLGEHPYDRYRAMYVGGVAAPVGVGLVPADPLTYDGNPQSLVSP
ncbi:hypothetical protein OG616_36850 [Streptomyces antibioticus]|uniref:hypothetical protein n=1 Tax=Streptomyces antibioticus TaxID=1890 RepID=UPI0022591467|nr:hypothetical protein [Streptomyces antibioticus]MCX5173571.1 hypothetical protein [Streptomyces antibioticus]